MISRATPRGVNLVGLGVNDFEAFKMEIIRRMEPIHIRAGNIILREGDDVELTYISRFGLGLVDIGKELNGRTIFFMRKQGMQFFGA